MDVKALYELQKVDTAIEQARAALEKLPERTHHAQALSDLAHVRSTRDNLRREQLTMEAELADIEKKSVDIDTHRAKLERQMKTIIDLAAAAKNEELVALQARRVEVASVNSDSDIATYDRLRASYKGIAVAVIQHGVCGGCHMDISVSELDIMKRLPADQVAECPNCNRLLVR